MSRKRPLSEIPTGELRAAARVWRLEDERVDMQRRANLFGFLLPKINMSLHDRIDDMIGEIERLRRAAK